MVNNTRNEAAAASTERATGQGPFDTSPREPLQINPSGEIMRNSTNEQQIITKSKGKGEGKGKGKERERERERKGKGKGKVANGINYRIMT